MRRRLLQVLAVVAGVLLAATFLVPLAVQGPRFAALVLRFVPPLQGTVRLAGGGLGAGAFWAYVLGRPVPVRLEGLSVLDPEGEEVFRSDRLTASIEFQRTPLRVFLHDLRPGKSMWRFARMRKQRGVGFLRAWVPKPRPEPPAPFGPALPPDPAVKPAAKPDRPFRGAFGIVNAHLDGLDAIFNFGGWGLELADIRAKGFLRIEFGTGRPPITFDAREVLARKGGFLRILGGSRATVIPFDSADIERVGTPEDGPSNLLLLVNGAMTGPSKLSGKAVFPYLFPGRPPGTSKGLSVDATWEQAGPGLTAAAASRGIRGLSITGDKAHLRAKVTSWFRDIDGTFSVSGLDMAYRGYRINDAGVDLSIVGPPVHLALDRLRFSAPQGGSVRGSASMTKEGAARFDLVVDNVVTTGVLSPYLHPLLGGTAVGTVSLRGNLPAQSATLEGIDLTLDRIRRGPLPRRLRLVAGQPVVPAGLTVPTMATAAPAPNEQLVVRLGRAGYDRGQIAVAGLAATLFGAEVRAGPLRLTWPHLRGLPPGPPVLDLTMAVRNFDLGRAMPGTGLTGTLGLSSRVRGPLDDVAAQVRFSPGAALTFFDQTYVLPKQAGFGVHGGEELVVPTLTLAAPGGGSLSLAGRLVLDRRVDMSVVAEGHRLDRVPFVSRALPSLGGKLGGRLHVSGEPLHPSLDGNVRLAGVTLAGVSLGDGAIKLAALAPGRSTLKGSLFDKLAVAGNLDFGTAGPAFDATVDAASLTLDPFLPELPFVRGGRLRVGGRLSLAAHAGRPLEIGAALDSLLLAYDCRAAKGDPRGPGCVVMESKGPLRARSRGGASFVELERAQFVAPESNFSLAGKLNAGSVDAQLRGRFSLGLLSPLFQMGGRRLLNASGVIDGAISAQGPVRAPALSGAFDVVSPVRLHSPIARIEVRVPDGQLAFDPTGISSRGLRLEAAGAKLALAGEVPLGTLIGEAPKPGTAARALAVNVVGTIDVGLLPRFLPEWIAEARGTAEVKAKVAGTVARPSIDGEAKLGAITLTTRPNKTQAQRFRVALQGGRITARGSQLTVSELVADVTPGGHVVVGPRGRPAEVELVSLDPPVLGKLTVPVIASALNADVGWLKLDDGAVDLLLQGDARGAMALSGLIDLAAGRFSPGKRPAPPARPRAPAPAPGAARAPAAPAPPSMKLDVRVKTDGQRFVIDPGWLPNLHLGLDVRVGGTLAKPAVLWDAEGKGPYSRFALFLFRLFS